MGDGAGRLSEVQLGVFRLERFVDVLPRAEYEAFISQVEPARALMEGRRLWNVNSTARGGGVAELLLSLLPYARAAGVDARWLVLSGDRPFFAVTKRVHNLLHCDPGDGGRLDAEARAAYERVTAAAAADLLERTDELDVILLHDPQTAGLIPELKAAGRTVVWRCHVGVDRPCELCREAQGFLLDYARQADATIFSRQAHVWEGLDPARVHLIAPSLDAFSPKNQELDDDVVESILTASGILAGEARVPPAFTRIDGSRGEVDARAAVAQEQPLRPADRLAVQVSRWDRLKDPLGVLKGFAAHVAPHCDGHLMLAGPVTGAVADDPEDAAVYQEVEDAWRELPADVRGRVHLVQLPMDDAEENAIQVNALQRHALVAIQKSLAEGFGLTVAEAMWKACPVVASRAGGIADQVVDGVTGYLVEPADLEAFGSALTRLLGDEALARRMGQAAQERVREQYLVPRHLLQYLDLLRRLVPSPDPD